MPQSSLLKYGGCEKPVKSRAGFVPLVDGDVVYIGDGNAKIGPIWTFSLPVGATCPGMSKYCEVVCSVKNRNYYPSVIGAYERNLKMSKRADFASLVITRLRELRRALRNNRSKNLGRVRNILQGQYNWQNFSWNTDFHAEKYVIPRKVLRFHPSGDFYSRRYVLHWIEICTVLRDWKFFGFTHSWSVAALAPSLSVLRDLPNVQLYASVDPAMNGSTHGKLLAGWFLIAWTSSERPAGVPRCMQQVALYEKAFEKWKELENKPKERKNPGKHILRSVAKRFHIKPLYCVDCQYCLKGLGSVWHKTLTNQYTI